MNNITQLANKSSRIRVDEQQQRVNAIMTRAKLVILLTILFFPVHTPSLARVDDESPPYLYYYSHILGGLIVERADGTDSRHIQTDELPPGLMGVVAAGWSPTGRYFAGYRIDAVRPNWGGFVIDTNGASLINVLDELDPTQMIWVPGSDDLLLVASQTDYPGELDDSRPMITVFWLIDVEERQIIADTALTQGITTWVDLSRSEWELDRGYVAVYVSQEACCIVTPPKQIKLFLDGRVSVTSISNTEFDAHYPDWNDNDIDFLDPLVVSPSGTYELRNLVLQNMQTMTTYEIRLHSQGGGLPYCREATWSKDERYLLLFDGDGTTTGCGMYRGVSVAESEGQLRRELTFCAGYCAGWLPEDFDLSTLSVGSSEPILLEAAHYEQADYSFNSIYMPQDEAARLWCIDEDDIYILKVDSHRYQLNEVSCPFPNVGRYADEGAVVATAYLAEHQLLATFIDIGRPGITIWREQPDGTFDPVLWLNSQGFVLEFTGNGRYLRARNVNGWKVYAVEDIVSRIDTNSR